MCEGFGRLLMLMRMMAEEVLERESILSFGVELDAKGEGGRGAADGK